MATHNINNNPNSVHALLNQIIAGANPSPKEQKKETFDSSSQDIKKKQQQKLQELSFDKAKEKTQEALLSEQISARKTGSLEGTGFAELSYIPTTLRSGATVNPASKFKSVLLANNMLDEPSDSALIEPENRTFSAAEGAVSVNKFVSALLLFIDDMSQYIAENTLKTISTGTTIDKNNLTASSNMIQVSGEQITEGYNANNQAADAQEKQAFTGIALAGAGVLTIAQGFCSSPQVLVKEDLNNPGIIDELKDSPIFNANNEEKTDTTFENIEKAIGRGTTGTADGTQKNLEKLKNAINEKETLGLENIDEFTKEAHSESISALLGEKSVRSVNKDLRNSMKKSLGTKYNDVVEKIGDRKKIGKELKEIKDTPLELQIPGSSDDKQVQSVNEKLKATLNECGYDGSSVWRQEIKIKDSQGYVTEKNYYVLVTTEGTNGQKMLKCYKNSLVENKTTKMWEPKEGIIEVELVDGKKEIEISPNLADKIDKRAAFDLSSLSKKSADFSAFMESAEGEIAENLTIRTNKLVETKTFKDAMQYAKQSEHFNKHIDSLNKSSEKLKEKAREENEKGNRKFHLAQGSSTIMHSTGQMLQTTYGASHTAFQAQAQQQQGLLSQQQNVTSSMTQSSGQLTQTVHDAAKSGEDNMASVRQQAGQALNQVRAQ